MRQIAKLITLLFCFSYTASSATNFPFPQNATYSRGILPSGINNSDIQSAYQDFITRFYEESGDKARIKWDNSSQTVSEGIGYGMLIMVYMDNSANNTRGKFDKLWKYYNSFLDPNGLMNWKINGFNNVAEANAATDGDLDAAAALMEAYKQWGDESYINDARKLIDKIWNKEVNGNGYLKPGDAWDDKKNPSYFSTAALELFKNGGSQDWNRVITNSYSLLKSCRNGSTGLVPDWCSEGGNPLGDYKYDAARTPWRIAWAYVWNGNSDAKDICTKMTDWIKGTTNGDASKIVDGYTLSGGPTSQWNVSTFVGPFACAAMVDASYQSWLNNAYSRLITLKNEPYYSTCLRMITLLLLSGNMPDFWTNNPVKNYNLTITSNPSTGGSVNVNPSGTQFKSSTQVTLQAQPANGYRFVNWSGAVSGNETSKTITITSDMNITAQFEKVVAVTNSKYSHNANSLFSINKQAISYQVPEAGHINIELYNAFGKLICHFSKNNDSNRISSVSLDQPLPKGVYFGVLKTFDKRYCNRVMITE
jgi:endo-1,4-beta-D-glucanase Y